MKKIYIYPSYCTNLKNGNPFINCFHDNIPHTIGKSYSKDEAAGLGLIKHVLFANIFLLNWPENVVFRKYGFLQYILLRLCLYIILARNAKIIWVFHNVTPHQGHNCQTKKLYKFLYENSSLIITLSKDAQNYVQHRAAAEVIYECHPFFIKPSLRPLQTKKICDILIWGSVEPYKGILEFVKYINMYQDNKIRIKIVGKCKSSGYAKLIKEKESDLLSYENRFVADEDLARLISASRYVVFPYLIESVSSSGALMDSLLCHANVIGPCVGAFKDLEELGLCFTFKNYADIIDIVSTKKCINESLIEPFIHKHSWRRFGERVTNAILRC